MKFRNNIIELVGNTPLVRLNKVIESCSNLVLAKLEQYNPCGSVKDRIAKSMIEDAEEKGLLKPGGVVIEATSGNTGLALAFVAAVKGYKLIVIMPDSMSTERRKLFNLFGAQVELTQASMGMRGAIEKAVDLNNQIEGSFLVNQFDNPANVKAHEETTAQEIIDDTDGRVDTVIVGVGTGGTITGIGTRLKEYNPAIKIIAFEPASSAVLSGQESGPHMIQGIGAGFIPSIVDTAVIDDIITVSDNDAIHWAREIIKQEGILAGISSGAALRAAQKYLSKRNPVEETIVVIFPDTGERYLSISMFAKEK